MNTLKKIFKKDKNIVIGALHLPPLLGYSDFPGFNVAIKNAIKDLKTFEKGGVDAVIFENNYDIPHKEFVDPGAVASMVYLGKKIKEATDLPLGVSVLWNDYKAALSIAKVLNLQFVRVPVFVDDVETDYGVIKGNAKKVLDYRKKISGKDIAIFTDIHVKHAKLISSYDLIESAELAKNNGSDGLIITGKWTGEAPDLNDITKVREHVKNFPIFAGSGVDINNIKYIFQKANGAIVSTSLKDGCENKKETNIKKYDQRISLQKVKKMLISF